MPDSPRRAPRRAWRILAVAGACALALAAAAAALVGLVKGMRVAGGADAYGHVSQALSWLEGLPVQAEPLAAAVPWPHAEWSLAPLGFRPGLEPGTIVPTYPPGLPLAMAAAAGIGGTNAVYRVVPVLGAAAVWLTFLLGRRFADACTRAAAAPLVLLVTAAATAHAYCRHGNHRAVFRAAIMCALPLVAAAGFLAWLNIRLYGSPFASGYGAVSEHFALANVPVNTSRYIPWLLETQTPAVLLGLAAPVAARTLRSTPPGASSPAQAWFGLGFAAMVLACYLPYSPVEERWHLRFLLPAIPVLLILATAVLVRLAQAAPVLAACVGVLAWHYIAIAGERGAFALERLESRYLAAGAFA